MGTESPVICMVPLISSVYLMTKERYATIKNVSTCTRVSGHGRVSRMPTLDTTAAPGQLGTWVVRGGRAPHAQAQPW